MSEQLLIKLLTHLHVEIRRGTKLSDDRALINELEAALGLPITDWKRRGER